LTGACQGDYQASAAQRRLFVGLAARMVNQMTNPFLWLASALIWAYIYMLIAAAVLSWLIAFSVVNTRNQFVGMVAHFLYRVTEPALRPIRKLLPNLGGIDISPVILIIGLMFLEQLIYWLYLQVFR
jgi:YggT family protein